MAKRQPLATSEEVAAYLKVSERTLDDWAYRGCGPEFCYAGQQRRYRWENVEKYLAERSRGGRAAANAT
jgi:predicted site-specific integrase-resolvase